MKRHLRKLFKEKRLLDILTVNLENTKCKYVKEMVIIFFFFVVDDHQIITLYLSILLGNYYIYIYTRYS